MTTAHKCLSAATVAGAPTRRWGAARARGAAAPKNTARHPAGKNKIGTKSSCRWRRRERLTVSSGVRTAPAAKSLTKPARGVGACKSTRAEQRYAAHVGRAAGTTTIHTTAYTTHTRASGGAQTRHSSTSAQQRRLSSAGDAARPHRRHKRRGSSTRRRNSSKMR